MLYKLAYEFNLFQKLLYKVFLLRRGISSESTRGAGEAGGVGRRLREGAKGWMMSVAHYAW
jgi:hypothetical protein